MLTKMSVNALLKSLIASMGAAIVLLLALSAWDSWQRLRTANRIAAVADASGYVFTGLHNLRVYRASTYRDLLSDKPMTAPDALLRQALADEMTALNAAVKALDAVDFPERVDTVSDLAQRIKRLEALKAETTAAFLKSK